MTSCNFCERLIKGKPIKVKIRWFNVHLGYFRYFCSEKCKERYMKWLDS